MTTSMQRIDVSDVGMTAVVAHGILNALQGAVVGPSFFRSGADVATFCPLIRASLQLAIDSAEDLDPPAGPRLRGALLPAAAAAEQLEATLAAGPDAGADILAFIERSARRAEDILGGLVRGLPDDVVEYLDDLGVQARTS